MPLSRASTRGRYSRIEGVTTALRVAYEGLTRYHGAPNPPGHALVRVFMDRLALIFLPKNHIYSKKISVSFYPVWTPFDMDLLNKKHATNRNWHWALDQYVSPKNSIKSCQKYMKVVEYWHGTIKNYRYGGDVSASPSLIPARPREVNDKKDKFWCGMLPNIFIMYFSLL